GLAWQARNVRKVSWLGRITHINDRGAAVFGLSGQSVHGLWHVYRSTVMPDIGDVAVALMMDRRLVSATGVQIVVSDESHISCFRRIADLGRLCQHGEHQEHQSCTDARRHGTCAVYNDERIITRPPRRRASKLRTEHLTAVVLMSVQRRSVRAADLLPP